jgi:hypothetical protein
MKQFHQLYAFCAMLLAVLLLAGCGWSAGGQVAEPTTLPPTVTPEDSTQSDLEAVLWVPSTLPGGDAVPLEFTLINHTQAGLYLLNWFTPFEGLGGEILDVKRDGQPIPYRGPLAARADPTPDAYVYLDAGASVSAAVDLAKAYDFSEPGEYTIAFLSPKLSHLAKTEAQMATSVDDLGPVEIPSNRVTLRIASSSDSPVRRTRAEAAERIRDYLEGQKPKLSPDVRLPLEEFPLQEAWDYLRVQLFRIADGPFMNESFLIDGESVLPLGTAFGGRGLTSLQIADLDGDGSAELLFTYAFGSGLHQSRIGMYAPAHGKDRLFEAGTGFLGDLSLFKEGMSTVRVRVLEPDDTTMTLRYLDTLGHLAIEQHRGQVELVLRVAEGLPEDVSQRLFELAQL